MRGEVGAAVMSRDDVVVIAGLVFLALAGPWWLFALVGFVREQLR